MARLTLIAILLLVGCRSTRTVTEYVPEPVEVQVPVPVDVCHDRDFRMDFLQTFQLHEDFRRRLSQNPRQSEVIQATLEELKWRMAMLKVVIDHYTRTNP